MLGRLDYISTIVVLALIALVAVGASSEAQQPAGVPTYADWPKGAKAGSRGMVRNISPARHAFARVKAPHPVRYGRMSERFEIRDGDCGGSDCGQPRARSEIREDGTNIRARLNEETWVAWSFYNASIVDTSLNPVLGQWKVDDQQAIVKFFQEEAIPGYQTCRKPFCDVRRFPPSRARDVFVQLDDLREGMGLAAEANWGNVCQLFDLSAVRGRWIDILVNSNFATTNAGYLRVWIDGELRCDYRGRIVFSRSEYVGPSHRRGIYWSYTADWDRDTPTAPKPTMVAYYDEYRVGRTREQVDIRMIEAAGGPAVD